MAHAHRVVPPVTHVEECDVTELDATKNLANERDPDGPRLTYLPFIVKAVVAALKQYPALNASLDEDAGVEEDDIFAGFPGDLFIILVGVTIPPETPEETEAHLDELSQLVDTAGAEVVGRISQRTRRSGRSGGRGHPR